MFDAPPAEMSMSRRARNAGVSDNFQISFQSYGVKIGVRADSDDLLSAVKNLLPKINPHGFEIIDDRQAKHIYQVRFLKNKTFEVKKEEELLWSQEGDFLLFLQSQIRLTVAEFAESKVFLHAGAVGWRGKAILLPASSFSGKSSLVAALVKRGASYYSDDFAVLDAAGLVHPFHRQLSLRISANKYAQTDFAVEELGGTSANQPISVGLVFIGAYQEGYANPPIWEPEVLSGGQGVMEIIPHTIPIRYNPEFSLSVLNKVARRAIICRSKRGEAKEFADSLLNYFETKVI